MSSEDLHGYPLSTTSDNAAEHYCSAVVLFLRMGMGTDTELRAALEADGDFAPAAGLLSFLLWLRGQPEKGTAMARSARSMAEVASERERAHVELLTAAALGKAPEGAALADEHLERFPRDAVVLAVSSVLENLAGRRDRRQRRYAQVQRLAPDYGDDSFFLGVAAFAAQEVGAYAEARDKAERSLSADARNGWGTHAMTHALYETACHREGVAFLDRWLPDFDRRHPYHVHFSWHAALHELALGDLDALWTRYDRDIKPTDTTMAFRVTDSSSLLFRLELYGLCEDPLPWDAVIEIAVSVAEKGGLPLTMAHAAFVLALYGETSDLDRLRGSIEAAGEAGLACAPVLLGLCDAFQIWRSGDLAAAAAQLERLSADIVRIGGSNAQREVFEDALLHAWLRTDQKAKAARLLKERLNRRSSHHDAGWLASVTRFS